MKTKVVQHVPRINNTHLTYDIRNVTCDIITNTVFIRLVRARTIRKRKSETGNQSQNRDYIENSRFKIRVQDSRFKIQDSGFKIQN